MEHVNNSGTELYQKYSIETLGYINILHKELAINTIKKKTYIFLNLMWYKKIAYNHLHTFHCVCVGEGEGRVEGEKTREREREREREGGSLHVCTKQYICMCVSYNSKQLDQKRTRQRKREGQRKMVRL